MKGGCCVVAAERFAKLQRACEVLSRQTVKHCFNITYLLNTESVAAAIIYLFRSVQTPDVIVGRICARIYLCKKQMKLSECAVIEYSIERLRAGTMGGGKSVLKCARDSVAVLTGSCLAGC